MTSTQFPLSVSYVLNSDWTTGYQITVIVINNSNQKTNSWVSTFNLPPNQSITSSWNGTFKISGSTITVTNPTWSGGGTINANSSTSYGFVVQNSKSGPAMISNLQAVANATSITPPAYPPAAPVLNNINVASGSNNYTISWSSVSNVTSYILQQDTSSLFSNPIILIQQNILSYSVTNQPNGSYYYRVAAVNSYGSSPYSNTQNVSINVVIPTLTAPILSAISNSTGNYQFQVNWSTVTNATSYNLLQSTSNSFTNPQTIYSGSATYFNANVQTIGTYYYKVIAYATGIQSPDSNIQSTTVTQVAPKAVTSLEGYWESWNSKDTISSIVNMKCDIIDISFGTFSSTGSNIFSITGVECSDTDLASIVSQTHSLGKKIKLSIGGATYGLSGLLTSSSAAQGMAQAIAQYVTLHGLDGVDLDIEDYPAANLQIQFIQNIRQQLGPNSIITYTPKSPAATTLPYSDVIQGAHPYLTSIMIMAYDYGSKGSYSYQQDANALVAMGVPINKIVIGLMPGRDDLNVVTSVTDIVNASNYVVQNGLGGIMFWDLNRDLENLTGLGISAATNAAYPIVGSNK